MNLRPSGYEIVRNSAVLPRNGAKIQVVGIYAEFSKAAGDLKGDALKVLTPLADTLNCLADECGPYSEWFQVGRSVNFR